MKKLLFAALAAILLLCGFSANALAAPYAARFVSQTGVTNAMGSGQPYQVSVTFQNTGDNAWTDSQVSLAMPTGLWTFGDPQVRLAPGEVVDPGAYKTFTWTFHVSDCWDGCPNGNFTKRVDRVPPKNQIPTQAFEWQMVWIGNYFFGDRTPKVDVEIFWVPVTRTTLNDFPAYLAAKPPVPLSDAAALTFQNFRGADLLGGARFATSLHQMPTAVEMDVMARRMIDMNLNVLRVLVDIPAAGDSNHNWDAEMDQMQSVFDIADKYGIKVMPSLGGYLKYTGSDIESNLGPVAEKCLWYGSFESRKVNAERLVDRFKNHHALFAWLLHSEPIWTMYSGGTAPVPDGCPGQTLADYQSVVNAVHAMYKVVRDRDAVHPTAVADSPNPVMGLWKPISSFASTHLYFDPRTICGLRDVNGNLEPLSDANIACGIPKLQSFMDASILQTQRKVAPLKVIIGETGFEMGTNVLTRTQQADGYREIFASFQRNNVGSAFWSLSSWADQAPWSLITTAASRDSNGNPAGPWGELIPEPTNVIRYAIGAVRNAEVASYNVPSTMQAGQPYMVSVTFRNTGNVAWSRPADFQLGSRMTEDNMTWGVNRLTYGQNERATMPGETKTFNFVITAPLDRRVHDFSWGMMQQAVERFGPALTIPVAVQ